MLAFFLDIRKFIHTLYFFFLSSISFAFSFLRSIPSSLGLFVSVHFMFFKRSRYVVTLITRIYECIFFSFFFPPLFYVRLTRNNRFKNTRSITKARIYMLANFNLLFVNNRYLWPSLIGNACELSFFRFLFLPLLLLLL